MILPTIHSNGTTKDELIKPLLVVAEKLEEAYQALKLCAPNGRDYYPQSNTAIYTATDEHMARLRAIDKIKQEIEEYTIAICELTVP